MELRVNVKAKGDIGSKIRTIRKGIGISGKDFARVSTISESYISQIENNQVVPANKTLSKIIDAIERLPLAKIREYDKELNELREFYSAEITEGNVMNSDEVPNVNNVPNDVRIFTTFLYENKELIYKLMEVYNSPYRDVFFQYLRSYVELMKFHQNNKTFKI